MIYTDVGLTKIVVAGLINIHEFLRIPVNEGEPAALKENKGNFRISKKTVIAVQDEGDRNAANYLKDYINRHYGLSLDIDRQEGKDYIRLITKKIHQGP